MDHPVVEKIMKTGYPTKEASGSTDFYDTEIMVGDTYILDELNGEIIHEDNLKRYLEEQCDFKFKEE